MFQSRSFLETRLSLKDQAHHIDRKAEPMFLEIVTTITSRMDLSGEMSVSHKVDIDAEDAEGLPTDAIYALVVGGCNATINSIKKERPRLDADEAAADDNSDYEPNADHTED